MACMRELVRSSSGVISGFFVQKDPLANRIAKKDHMSKTLSKRTPSLVAAGAAGDTWRLPPCQEAAGPAATGGGGHPLRTDYRQCFAPRRNGAGQVGPAATG